MLFVRSRCFRMKWVIEFDIVGLFDNINHGKLLELIEKHCQEKWIFPYIERCLKTPVLMPDKRLKERNASTPQGGVISLVFANLFMHYAFDEWMAGRFPKCSWERQDSFCPVRNNHFVFPAVCHMLYFGNDFIKISVKFVKSAAIFSTTNA